MSTPADSRTRANDEIDAIAKYLSREVCGDDVFDGDQSDALEPQRDWYRTQAIGLMRTMRSLGWQDPPRRAGQTVHALPMPMPTSRRPR